MNGAVEDVDLTPTEVARRLILLTRRLHAEIGTLRELGEDAAKARQGAEVAYARTFLSVEGAMDVRKQEAMVAASDARFAADVADRRVTAQKEVLKAIHADIEVGRSLSATSRDEMRLAGSGAMGA